MIEHYQQFLLEEIEKHSLRFHRYHNSLHLEHERIANRIQNPPVKYIKRPSFWTQSDLYNPFHVKKKMKSITKSICSKLEDRSYEPRTPIIHQVPKANGKMRDVSIYQIPDAAVSNMLYHSLLSKNKHRFSPLSYAYRNDRNVHFAIQDISIELKRSNRFFLAEFDFSDFFGSIEHKFLMEQLSRNGFLITEFEKGIIKSFLEQKSVGVPQGTSISLFLANVACWELDRNFEKLGLRFARYADDTVVWSEDYDKICKSYNLIEEFSRNSGVKINYLKSSGISLLTNQGAPAELPSQKTSFDFLGYKLSTEVVGIKDLAVRKIKKNISYILYRNLIQPLTKHQITNHTIPSNGDDPSFVTAMMQIRRYLYGGVNESMIKRYLKGDLKRINFKGLMSFYPLVDHEDQLKALDKWLISTILKVLRKRKKLLVARGLISGPYSRFPFNLNSQNIVIECKTKRLKRKVGLIEVPSFLRIYRAIKKGMTESGIETIMNKQSTQYSY